MCRAGLGRRGRQWIGWWKGDRVRRRILSWQCRHPLIQWRRRLSPWPSIGAAWFAVARAETECFCFYHPCFRRWSWNLSLLVAAFD